MATSLHVSASPVPFFCATKRTLRRPSIVPFSTRSSSLPLPSFRYLSSNYKRWTCFSKDASTEIPIGHVDVDELIDEESCELVRGSEIEIGESEVTLHAYLLEAVKNNNGAGIILLSDIFGFQDSSTRDFAYRVACTGYNVLIPDLFRGNAWKQDQDSSKFERWLASHPPETVAKDIGTSAQWMIEEFAAVGVPTKLGIMGFCFGGSHLVQTLAKDERKLFTTGVCLYGTGLNVSLASHVKVPVLFISGDNDPLCPVAIQKEMTQNIKGSKLVVYSDRGHDFAHRPQSQEDDDDAESSFGITKKWLHDFLVVKKDLAQL